MALYEIPTGSAQRRMTVDLGGVTYGIRIGYADTEDGGWFLDIRDGSGNPLVCGIPLVTGTDLLEQLGYLGIPGRLYVLTDAQPDAVPTYAGLGTQSHLLFEPF